MINQIKSLPGINITEISPILSVITKHDPNLTNTTISIYIDGGSSKETPKNSGIAHVLEHMFFKGIKKNGQIITANGIAKKMESLGCLINAFTSFECVAYWFNIAPSNNKKNLLEATQMLWDMLIYSYFPEEELEKEKKVILQEYYSYKDDLSSLCSENFYKITYDSYLGRDIIGTIENINSFTSEDLKEFILNHYKKFYFIVTGNFDEELMINTAKEYSAFLDNLINCNYQENIQKCTYQKEEKISEVIKDDATQARVIMGWESVSCFDNAKYIAEIISAVMGKGMSSILFSRIREQMGLVYSIHSETDFFLDTGHLSVSFQCLKEKIDEIITTVNGIVKDEISLGKITDEQLENAKTMVKASIIRQWENNMKCNYIIGHSIIQEGKLFDFDEYITKIDQVTCNDIVSYCKKFLNKSADKISKILPGMNEAKN